MGVHFSPPFFNYNLYTLISFFYITISFLQFNPVESGVFCDPNELKLCGGIGDTKVTTNVFILKDCYR